VYKPLSRPRSHALRLTLPVNYLKGINAAQPIKAKFVLAGDVIALKGIHKTDANNVTVLMNFPHG
jgi:hypothetical protein